MKNYLVLLVALLASVGVVMGTPKTKEPPKKQALEARVDQVLEEGLLIIAGNSVLLLKGHPDAKKMADNDKINCYAMRTEEVHKYTAVNGAERTARVYVYHGKRMGGR
jgi:hypothetical protein